MNQSRKIIYLFSFIEGATVIAIELAGGRMAALYYGNSLQVWSIILGLTISGLAAGYFSGGWLSGEENLTGASQPVRIYRDDKLYFLFALSSLFIAIMPGFGDLIMKMTMILGYDFGSFVSVLLFLFPAMVVLGSITPVIVKMLCLHRDASGKETGKVFGISTLGGIFAAVLAGFYLIPDLGLRKTTYIFAFATGLIPMLFFIRKKPLYSLGLFFFLFLFIFTGMIKPRQKANSHIQIRYRSDGLLGQVIVVDDLHTERRSVLVNGISQTFMHLASGRSQWRYVHRLSLYSSFKPAGSKALVCGVGGGNLINEMINLGFDVDAVDIDKRMGEVANQFFNLNPKAILFSDDGRHYIKKCQKKYDIIIFDMSLGETQPSNIYTKECFGELKKILQPDGVIFVHYQNAVEGVYATAAKSIGKTLIHAGFVTRMVNSDKFTDDGKKQFWDRTSEIIYFASHDTIHLDSFDFARRDRFVDPFNFPVGKTVFVPNYDFSEGWILTDDRPVMDILHANTLEVTRQLSLDELIPIMLRERVSFL